MHSLEGMAAALLVSDIYSVRWLTEYDAAGHQGPECLVIGARMPVSGEHVVVSDERSFAGPLML